ncbi:MBL fold metallo-hydrolase [Microbacterium sp. NPDC077057]|uniref:MBL fold metallo-hydrolase n=1 Tax=unclassified Microbacterium TaxID=2609290 RepID=UPI00344331E9
MSRGRQWTEVVPGFFGISVADVNCYLVQTADGLTLFDAGLPRSRGVLRDLLGHLGAKETDIDAVVLRKGTARTCSRSPGCSSPATPS